MLKIKAYLRANKKTKAARRIRKNEKCPANICKGSKDLNITIELHNKDIQHPNVINHFYKNNIIQLMLNTGKIFTVKIQEIQYHPYKSKIIHIDFIHMTKTVN